jgi:hypothetical protein
LDPLLGGTDCVRLRDGRSVLIRPARRSDAELVQAFVRTPDAVTRLVCGAVQRPQLVLPSDGARPRRVALVSSTGPSSIAYTLPRPCRCSFVMSATTGLDGVEDAVAYTVSRPNRGSAVEYAVTRD